LTPEEVQQLYKLVFTSDDAAKVLEDLEHRFCIHGTTFSTEPTETAYREGQRTVVLFIKSMLRDKPKIKEQYLE
tara:strand:- start:1464 stop:1685 length:222 start_codon:yes stop_codon:yes gene_type:complete